MSGRQGRARSQSFSAEDSIYTNEIDSLPGNEGSSSTAPTSSATSSDSDLSTGVLGSTVSAGRSKVSKKTIEIMTKLGPSDGIARIPGLDEDGPLPVGGGGGGSGGGLASGSLALNSNYLSTKHSEQDDEEAKAEAEIAAQEKKKLEAFSRAGAANSSSSGAGGLSNSTSVGVGGKSGINAANAASGSSSSASSSSSSSSSSAAAPRRGVRGGKGAADDDYDVQVKVLLLGDSGVGKTSLMQRYSENKFSSSLLSTAGVDYKSQMIDIEGRKVKCQIWDTAGQQRFHIITHSYYKNAHGIVLVFDVSEPLEESFNNIRYWMENINQHASPNTQKLLVANKIDVKGGRRIETARGKALADEFGLKYFETSAKDGTNVAEAFNTVAKDAVLQMLSAGGNNRTTTGAQTGKQQDKNCVIC
jgi:Ras-related protein Rab-8A